MGIEKPTVSTAGVGCNCTASNFGLLSLAEVESREHKARGKGQEHKKDPRQRTDLPRTDLLEAKDTMRKCSPKKRSLLKKKSEVFREYQA